VDSDCKHNVVHYFVFSDGEIISFEDDGNIFKNYVFDTEQVIRDNKLLPIF
jgi:hypothetical protein